MTELDDVVQAALGVADVEAATIFAPDPLTNGLRLRSIADETCLDPGARESLVGPAGRATECLRTD